MLQFRSQPQWSGLESIELGSHAVGPSKRQKSTGSGRQEKWALISQNSTIKEKLSAVSSKDGVGTLEETRTGSNGQNSSEWASAVGWIKYKILHCDWGQQQIIRLQSWWLLVCAASPKELFLSCMRHFVEFVLILLMPPANNLESALLLTCGPGTLKVASVHPFGSVNSLFSCTNNPNLAKVAVLKMHRGKLLPHTGLFVSAYRGKTNTHNKMLLCYKEQM